MIRTLGFMDKVNTMRYVVMFRSPIAFLCGVGSVFLTLTLGALFQEPPDTTKLSVIIVRWLTVLAIYPLAGWSVACCSRHPLRAACRLTFGVFVGIILHIVLFPSIGGYERNLFPFEIAIHTIWAGVLCFLIAVFWKVK